MAPTLREDPCTLPSAVRSSMVGQGRGSLGAQRRVLSSFPRTCCLTGVGSMSGKSPWREVVGSGLRPAGRGSAAAVTEEITSSFPPELSRVPEVSGERGSVSWLLGAEGWRAHRGWGQTQMHPNTTPHKFRASDPLPIKWVQGQRGYTCGKQADEKMLDIICHEENGGTISLYCDGCDKHTHTEINAGEEVEKLEPSRLAGGHVNSAVAVGNRGGASNR